MSKFEWHLIYGCHMMQHLFSRQRPERQKRLQTPLFCPSTLKNELVHHQTYHTRDEASREIFAFIEGFYNRQRLHQSLGYLSPLEFERRISDS